MSKFFLLTPVLVFFLNLCFSAFSGDVSDQIVLLYRLKDGGKKEIRNDFSPGENIYADFIFLPKGEQTSIEFRWINPSNEREQVYSELIKPPIPPKKQTILCWLYLPSSLPDKVIGSRFFGRWLLEVWVNGRRAAEKAFDVGN